MINRENLIKIGRAGDNTSNRETPDQIGRVGISAIGVAKMRRNIAEMSFRANFRRKAPKSQEILRNSFALLLHNTVNTVSIHRIGPCKHLNYTSQSYFRIITL